MIGMLAAFISGVLLTATRVHALDNGVARLPGMSSFCKSFSEADGGAVLVLGYNSEYPV